MKRAHHMWYKLLSDIKNSFILKFSQKKNNQNFSEAHSSWARKYIGLKSLSFCKIRPIIYMHTMHVGHRLDRQVDFFFLLWKSRINIYHGLRTL